MVADEPDLRPAIVGLAVTHVGRTGNQGSLKSLRSTKVTTRARSHTQVSRRTLLKSATVGLSAVTPVTSFKTTPAFSDPAPRVKGFIDQRENETIRGLIQKFVDHYSLPGFSLAMSYQGELKLVACHGFAHQEDKERVTPRQIGRAHV